jgi:hypothetical protein
MPVTQNAPAPYAPSTAILSLIERHRQRGLPSPVDSDVLTRAGISESLIPRTLYALQVLDLIDNQGKPTEVIERLRLAPEGEFKTRMGEWLNSSYADALKFIDPATADETKIRDAFRSYNPVGQRDRMVTLFTGLFEAAGVMPERKRQRSKTSPKNGETVRRPRTAPPSPTTTVPEPSEKVVVNSTLTHADPEKTTARKHSEKHHPLIEGLLATLPPEGDVWATKNREKWLTLAESVFALIYKDGESEPGIKSGP